MSLQEKAMNWSESLCIGVAKIDSQHRKLIGMVQQLENALDGGNTVKEMGRTLKSVVDYTNYHFKDEEDLMVQINFQGYDEHVKQHAKLIEDVRSILLAIRGGKAYTAQDLIKFLTDWVLDHIEKEDKKIGGEIERRRPTSSDASKIQAHVKKAPTQEIKVSLNTLKLLLSKELISADDYQGKKKELLEKYVKKFNPKSFIEVTEEFGEFHSLLMNGLIAVEDEKHFRPLMSGRIDLVALFSPEDPPEERFKKMSGLLENGIITQEIYDNCKAALLKKL
jgi:hemerythrin-like metal-binding protein